MVKAIILLLFAVFIFILHETRDIERFINPNYLHFSQIASVIFLFLFFIQVPRVFSTTNNQDHSQCGPFGCNHENEKGLTVNTIVGYSVIILPLLTGFLLPYKDFGAAEALKRGVSYTSHAEHGSVDQYEEVDNQIDDRIEEMLKEPTIVFNHKNFISYYEAVTNDPKRFVGKPIVLEGFMLQVDSFPSDLTVITRFLVTHCIADAHAAGLVIESSNNLRMQEIQENTWIRVEGELNVKKHNNMLIPTINVSDWKKIQSPVGPYIYPKD